MTIDLESILHPFVLPWQMRNVVADPVQFARGEFCITGTFHGEYPIDAWKPMFLEVPKKGTKKDIIGRSHYVFDTTIDRPTWDHRRVIQLPEYSNCKPSDNEKMRFIVRHWRDLHIPDDVPCISIVVKCQGLYSENISAQTLFVLFIWSDSFTRSMSLDWSEGHWEDCQTPEWFIQSSTMMDLEQALGDIQGAFDNLAWTGQSFSIFTLPSCLGHGLGGEVPSSPYRHWGCGWNYEEYGEFQRDLRALLDDLRAIFSSASRTDEEEGGALKPEPGGKDHGEARDPVRPRH